MLLKAFPLALIKAFPLALIVTVNVLSIKELAANYDLCKAGTHSCSVGQTCRNINTKGTKKYACCTGECQSSLCSKSIGRLNTSDLSSTTKIGSGPKWSSNFEFVDSGLFLTGCLGRLSSVQLLFAKKCKIFFTAWQSLGKDKFQLIGKTPTESLKAGSAPTLTQVKFSASPATFANQTLFLGVSVENGKKDDCYIYTDPTADKMNILFMDTGSPTKQIGDTASLKDTENKAPLVNFHFDDIDECLQNLHNCSKDQVCVNTELAYMCTCRHGYAHANASPWTQCINIDECRLQQSVCSKDSICMDTRGSYRCIPRPTTPPTQIPTTTVATTLPTKQVLTTTVAMTAPKTQTPQTTKTATEATTPPVTDSRTTSTPIVMTTAHIVITQTSDTTTHLTTVTSKQATSSSQKLSYSSSVTTLTIGAKTTRSRLLTLSAQTSTTYLVHGSTCVTADNTSNSTTQESAGNSPSFLSGTVLGAVSGVLTLVVIAMIVAFAARYYRQRASRSIGHHTSSEKLFKGQGFEQFNMTSQSHTGHENKTFPLAHQGSEVSRPNGNLTLPPGYVNTSAARGTRHDNNPTIMVESCYDDPNITQMTYMDAKMPEDWGWPSSEVSLANQEASKIITGGDPVYEDTEPDTEVGYSEAMLPQNRYAVPHVTAGRVNSSRVSSGSNYENEPKSRSPFTDPSGYTAMNIATLDPKHPYQSLSAKEKTRDAERSSPAVTPPLSTTVLHHSPTIVPRRSTTNPPLPSPTGALHCSTTNPPLPSPTLLSNHSPQGQAMFTDSDRTAFKEPPADAEELLKLLRNGGYTQIARDDIKLGARLGLRKSAKVVRAAWKVAGHHQAVAVKMIDKKSSAGEKLAILTEASIIGQFSHKNIIHLHGVVSTGNPVYIVLEFMEKGDLLNYLRSLLPENGGLISDGLPNLFLRICRDIACGMEYLSRKQFVHKDLAARNILIDSSQVCKIGHFGSSSSNLDDDDFYLTQQGKVPVRWAAPEALLFNKYSMSSDVWSFGVILYEVFALGRKPYDGRSAKEVVRLVAEEKYRLPPPPGCSRSLYQLIIDCWNPDDGKRPHFLKIVRRLADVNPVPVVAGSGTIVPETMLGTPLACSESLHQDLQTIYK